MSEGTVPGGCRTARYLAALVTGWGVTAGNVVVGLWLTPFVLRYLDRRQYGIFALAAELIWWLTLLDVGMAAALRVHLARLAGRPSLDAINRYCSTAFYGQLMASFAILALGCGLTWSFVGFFGVPPALAREAAVTMGILVLGAAVSVAAQTFSAILVACQQIHVDNLIRLLLLVLRTVLTLALIVRGWGLVSLAMAHAAAAVLTLGLAAARSKRLVRGLRIRRSAVSFEVFRELLGSGAWFSVGSLAGLLILGLDRAVAGKLISLEAVTVLTLSGRLYSLAQVLIDQVPNNARPALGQLLGQGKFAEAGAAYRSLQKTSTALAIAAALAIWAANQAFVSAWVGAENYGGWALDAALGLNLIVNTWALPNRAALSAGLVLKPQALGRLAEGAVNLFLSLGLTAAIGLAGTALSTSLAAILTSLWFLPVLVAGMLGSSAGNGGIRAGDVLRLAALFCALMPVATYGRRLADGMAGYSGALLAGSMTTAAAAVLFWLLMADAGLRSRLRNLFPLAVGTLRRANT